MAIYRGKGGKTDVVPADGDQEFAGSIIAEKDIHAHGNISADGDITIKGDINWDGTISGDGSGLENVPTPFLQADDCIYLNNQVIDSDYTMPVGKNGMSAGDITINGTVTIPTGSLWHVVGDDKEVTLDVLGIPNHELMVVDTGGNVTATSFNGDGSGLTGLPLPDAYTRAEIDAQQDAQNTEINKKAATVDVDTKNNLQDIEIATKLGDAPSDGEQYVRKDGVWAELAAAGGGIADAPADGKTYGRKDLKWEEVTSDAYTESETDTLLDDKADKSTTYTKTEVDASQLVQDTKIETLSDDIDALTGSVIYKGSLNATVTPAPAGATTGDMWINEYNSADPATDYPVASGWSPVTQVKYDDKLIKTDTGWDKIASVVGVPSYTAGEIDDLLDDKADKTDVYTKTEIDAQQIAQDDAIQDVSDAVDLIPDVYSKAEVDASQALQDTEIATKADIGDSYLKAETDTLLNDKADVGDSYTKAESDTELAKKADTATTYTKTEVDDSQNLQDIEIAKKADKATTYTKDEVDELLESASGAIIGNYTNKWASSVARDPEAGNLYLVNGMVFSSKYDEVTKIYISDTDGDGEVRDFDEVKEDDKIKLTSELGSGEYTIVGTSDVSGYRELIVSIDSSNGTIANDSPVSIVLDVASSGDASGGIPEAPVDGKQYARKDADWTEVAATGSTPTPEDLVWEDVKADRAAGKEETNTNNVPLYVQIYTDATTSGHNQAFYIDDKRIGITGSGTDGGRSYATNLFIVPAKSKYKLENEGGSPAVIKEWHEARMPLAIAVGGTSSGTAEPPVAFNLQIPTQLSGIANKTLVPIDFPDAILDTDSGADGEGYVVQKAGIYDLTARVRYDSVNVNNLVKYQTRIVKNDTDNLGISYSTPAGKDTHYTQQASDIVTATAKLEVGDVLRIKVYFWTADGVNNLISSGSYSEFSGHMISSLTEGEVKEKEAVVVTAKLGASLPIVTGTWTALPFNTIHDTNGSYDVANKQFKPKVAGYYQINYQARFSPTGGTVAKGNRQALELRDKDANRVAYVSQGFDDTSNSDTTNLSTIVYFDGISDYVVPQAWADYPVITIASADQTLFSAHLITGQSSGGGSSAPEKMKWNTYLQGADPVTERDLDTVYKNDSNVPRYVQIYVNCLEADRSLFTFNIDDELMGYVGQGLKGTPSGSNSLHTNLYIVPAGSKYELKDAGNGLNDIKWHEADMPLAVATGGKSIAFRGHLSANQDGIANTIWTKVNLNTATTDTDNALTGGTFKPSVAGYYQVSGSVGQFCTPNSTRTNSAIYKNGSMFSVGSVCTFLSETYGTGGVSSVSDVIYLDPKNKWTDADGNEQVGDCLELWCRLTSSGTRAVLSTPTNTFLSAILISGGSASGDSGITQEHGEYTPTITNLSLGNGTQKAVYTKTGDMVTFKITVIFGSTTTFTGQANGIVDGLPFLQHEDWYSTPISGYVVDAGTTMESMYTSTGNSGSKNTGYLQVNSGTSTGKVINSTVPWAWAVNDKIHITGTYRIKS